MLLPLKAASANGVQPSQQSTCTRGVLADQHSQLSRFRCHAHDARNARAIGRRPFAYDARIRVGLLILTGMHRPGCEATFGGYLAALIAGVVCWDWFLAVGDRLR